jgi:hypothetical protein
MKPNSLFLYYLDKELQKYESDPEHYKSYDEGGKELEIEYNKCVEQLRQNKTCR